MENLSSDEVHRLRGLLERKLGSIPVGHLPALTLADVVDQTPNAVKLAKIPSDLQLKFLLTNRVLIDSCDRVAIKNKYDQHIDITRAIFFYRLDEAHQFQRYHDSHRWNVAIFLALLTIPRDSDGENRFGGVDFPPAARRFAIKYIDAVLEHHNTPGIFEKREAFVRLWKGSAYDFFTFGLAQKKLVRRRMKRLTMEWEKELDRMMAQMEKTEYERKVAGFVGALMPGRMDQRAPQYPAAHQKENDGQTTVLEAGTLLSALQVPIETTQLAQTSTGAETVTVTKTRDAIDALQKSVPSSMLHMLMELFPLDVKNEMQKNFRLLEVGVSLHRYSCFRGDANVLNAHVDGRKGRTLVVLNCLRLLMSIVPCC